ncbi:MAG: GrpB family protein [Chloroflexi bacterium]|nr:GrpB family protein [Chloroflexota bacterium]
MVSSNKGKAIVIADYYPSWPERFEAERDLIYATCGRDAFTRIEHMGSTAVPGLAAKPIIDMMPGIRALDDARALVPKLKGIGYAYVPEFEQDTPSGPGIPLRRYFRKDVDGARAFHMHMVEQGSDFWVRHLRFRNYLRAFPGEARAYAELKRDLAAEFNARLAAESDTNVGYTDRKTEFVERCMAAMEERIARGSPVVLAGYDPRWAEVFARLRAEIVATVGRDAADVQHVGSTAVPGLPAKPKVDIAVGAVTMERAAAIVEGLRPIGCAAYEAAQSTDDWIAMYWVEEGRKIANVHVVPHGGDRWGRYIAFRDYLRAHPEAVEEYAELKRDLAEEFGRDRLGYVGGKAEFIGRICRLAGVPA